MEELFHSKTQRPTACGKGFLRHVDLKSIVACLYFTDKPPFASSVMPLFLTGCTSAEPAYALWHEQRNVFQLLKTKTIFVPILNPQL